MKGLSIAASKASEVLAELDRLGFDLGAKTVKPAIERFDRTIIPFKNDSLLMQAVLIASEVEGSDAREVNAETVKIAIKAAERKKPAYTAREAKIARQRYDDIFADSVIVRYMSRAMHKAWVTRKEWDLLEAQGKWTHDWTVEYVFNGATYSQTGIAVNIQRAKRDILKFARQLRKSHRGARIRLAEVVEKTTGLKIDQTERAQKRLA